MPLQPEEAYPFHHIEALILLLNEDLITGSYLIEETMEAALSIYRPSIEIGALGWIVTWFITSTKDANHTMNYAYVRSANTNRYNFRESGPLTDISPPL